MVQRDNYEHQDGGDLELFILKALPKYANLLRLLVLNVVDEEAPHILSFCTSSKEKTYDKLKKLYKVFKDDNYFSFHRSTDCQLKTV